MRVKPDNLIDGNMYSLPLRPLGSYFDIRPVLKPTSRIGA